MNSHVLNHRLGIEGTIELKELIAAALEENREDAENMRVDADELFRNIKNSLDERGL